MLATANTDSQVRERLIGRADDSSPLDDGDVEVAVSSPRDDPSVRACDGGSSPNGADNAVLDLAFAPQSPDGSGGALSDLDYTESPPATDWMAASRKRRRGARGGATPATRRGGKRRTAGRAAAGAAAGAAAARNDVWQFVGTEVLAPCDITEAHVRLVYQMAGGLGRPACRDRVARPPETSSEPSSKHGAAVDDDTVQPPVAAAVSLVAVATPQSPLSPAAGRGGKKRGRGRGGSGSSATSAAAEACTPARCRGKVDCLNHLGQADWLKNDAFERFAHRCGRIEPDPRELLRKEGRPMGLKNLAATCYLNSLVQVDDAARHLQRIFAFLEYGVENYHDPTALLTALKINTGVQQDAQEFANLFLSHLETLFERQQEPSLKTESGRSDRFHDLELNVSDVNATSVEACLRSYLSEETLDAENKYFCEACQEKQDAKRAIRIRSLPEVLNLQLVRFVFDAKTMTRKKTRSLVAFPASLDLSPFISSDGPDLQPSHIYDLAAVLMHKGAAAHAGHFVARILDKSDEDVNELEPVCFEFDDEAKASSKKMATLAPDSPCAGAGVSFRHTELTETSIFASSSAYMLTYHRRGSAFPVANTPHAPPDIMQEVEVSNGLLNKQATDYEKRNSGPNAAIYSFFPQEDAVYVPAEILRRWFQDPLTEKPDDSNADEKSSPIERPTAEAVLDGLLCAHGKLSFENLRSFKRLSKAAVDKLVSDDHITLSRRLTVGDFCIDCVRDKVTKWRKKIPQFFQPQADRSAGFPSPTSEPFRSDVYCAHGNLAGNPSARVLVSEPAFMLLKDRLFPDLETLVQCRGADANDEECGECLALEALQLEATGPSRTSAFEEKSNLKLRRLLFGRTPMVLSSGVEVCVVSTDFLTSWKAFVNEPTRAPRPAAVRNSLLLCESHGLLVVDPAKDLRTASGGPHAFSLLSREEWTAFAERYEFDAAIEAVVDESRTLSSSPAVCADCRAEWLKSIDEFLITIEVASKAPPPPPPIPSFTTAAPSPSPPTPKLSASAAAASGGGGGGSARKRRRTEPAAPSSAAPTPSGARQSKRLRASQAAEFRVARGTTVLELKTMVFERWRTVPILQVLRRRRRQGDGGGGGGGEGMDVVEERMEDLADNSAMLGALGVLPGDRLEVELMKEDPELIELLD
ncbi:Ubiquitin carboxyl-terminal hydrolase 48, partial [Cladochytrium tenue]